MFSENAAADSVQLFLASQLMYFVTSCCVKMSIILFYRRVFPVRRFRLVADVSIGLVIAWGLATVLAAVLQCRPLHALWDKSINGHCDDDLKYVVGVQGANIGLDFLILFLPMPMVWGLHRPRQEKIALFLVFLLGGL